MKTRTLVATQALWFTAAVICSAAAAPNAQMGTWKLNESKSKLAPGTGKNTTVIYSAAGGNIKVAVEGVDKDGKPVNSVWMGKFDGKFYPVKGNPAYNAVAYKMVNDHTNDITATKDGKLAWTGKITVSADGKSRVVAISGKDAKGKKFTTKAVYDRG